jgi:hypothetical protein
LDQLDHKDQKDLWDHKDHKDQKDQMAHKETLENLDLWEHKDLKENLDLWDHKDLKDNLVMQDNKEMKDQEDLWDLKDQKAHMDLKDHKDTMDLPLTFISKLFHPMVKRYTVLKEWKSSLVVVRAHKEIPYLDHSLSMQIMLKDGKLIVKHHILPTVKNKKIAMFMLYA